MSQPTITALFGGTFDPIHYGHLKPAMALAEQVGLSKIYLMPNHIPPHKPQPIATNRQRLDMLALAIKDNPLFAINKQELIRKTTSYTIDTLIQWHQRHHQQAILAFIIGTDSLYTIDRWHRWQAILDYCHLLVCPRPFPAKQTISAELQSWLDQHLTRDIHQLRLYPTGKIFIAQAPLCDIASSEIKQRIKHNQDCSEILPPAVWQYIKHHQLYRN
ncbi:nicotinate-nucleotide adenylyltransferase [Utexia brackfieldae]|uniref:nicotinate-nucleotide adenylyltransferase n=1 Tax=Utexia brackfieldae TaxID=3074108 RepID=UPI00370D8760